ncbi:uncharacterized protein [Oryza sativa Japonica Group]|jgi:glutaredoxin|uniref:Domain found in Dishevelled, Egl-10, and Pleckstrin family protein, expressed n=2 Tax=Oryza sativa subsp. japonica TaxID=39947 RepID=Q8LNW2_ORYSJ|nr:uncharacterized protein LOC4348928 [Oryza sativa Japonica Group]AAM91894.1 hypothetical protein [Oryza sativa Japonica Group]AAP54320.1 Domain found in Dishevelled, Egl-10, and Pleckstrin family protein, expressed [Oryza sativa Japonica Group]KAF2914078.1 hypothetical protein DAI22_10g135500 [Oryza sativa Japonica Group]BAF26796.1 Os10g0482900 [Oryza sativa Japonica Group]BAT11354.1 Os10g0482900 [Oryza sativa Japonica Group]|eukprot:NP_001064882.1 Os10g0482900 [Oryza sativa Japonica Group]
MGEETLVAMPLAPPHHHHHHAHLPALPHLAAPPPPPPPPAETELTEQREEEVPVDDVVEAAADVPRREEGLVVDGGEDVYYARRMLQGVVLRPPPHLPQPEAPPGLTRALSAPAPDGYVEEEEEQRPVERSASVNSAASAVVVDVASIGRFFRDRRDVLSSAITRRISSLKEASSSPPPPVGMDTYGVQEIHLPNVKVTVRLKDAIEADAEEDDAVGGGGDDGYSFSGSHIKGRVSFFSRSGCRDCAAVRAFFRQSALPYVEINLDVFPEREAEFASRAGASARVPQIFLNEKLLGGLVVLNSLRNSGEFERRVRDLAGRRCPDTAPRVPVYGFDNDPGKEGGDREDAMVGIVRVLRHRLPIQDRIVRLKLVKNCFSGADMVDGIVNHLECSRKKAVEIGRELARKHFIHHVFRENDFEDGSQNLYRFLEHDPAIPKYYNFIRGATNDGEPKLAAAIGQRMTKIMVAILEAYASDDRRHLDYSRIAASEEFRRYANMVQELQRVDMSALPAEERLPFFLNLHNAMAIHAVVRVGQPGAIDRRSSSNFQYVVGGHPYSLATIRNGILRSNRRQPYTIAKPFGSSDKRLELVQGKVNPLVHFGLCDATRSSPIVRFFSTQGVEPELRHAARKFFLNGGVEIDLESRTVHLTSIIKWYSVDFGQDRETLKWILNYLDPTKAGLLTHLLNDGGAINISYLNYDWSLNV